MSGTTPGYATKSIPVKNTAFLLPLASLPDASPVCQPPRKERWPDRYVGKGIVPNPVALPPFLPPRPSLYGEVGSVVSSMCLAAVPNQLEPADHLADGEEAQALGQEHTASRQLCPRQVPDLLGVGVLQDVVDEDAGCLHLLPEALEVSLERRNGTMETEEQR